MGNDALDRAQLDASKSERLAALAVDCFRNQPQPSFRCTQNGPPVSPYDYLICRFQQEMAISESGTVARDSRSKAVSKAQSANLEAVLESMLNDIQETPLKSVSAVSAKWSSQLLKFNLPGVSAHQFVIQTLSSCFIKAEHQVRSESNNPNTALGQGAAALKSRNP